MKIRPLKWHTYVLNCTEDGGDISLYFARTFLNTKYLMQTNSELAIFFLPFYMYLMEKGFNKLGEFNYIYKSMFSRVKPACCLYFDYFSNDLTSCTWMSPSGLMTSKRVSSALACCSSPAEGGSLSNCKRGSIAHRLSLSPDHHSDVTEILLNRTYSQVIHPSLAS